MAQRLPSPKQPVRRIFGYLLGSFMLTFIVLFFMLINATQILSLLLYPFSRSAFRWVNTRMSLALWVTVMTFIRVYGLHVSITGDATPPRENVILVANHQDMSDIPLLIPIAVKNRMCAHLKWYAKWVLKYVPGFGWGMQFLNCIFLKRDWSRDKDSIMKTFEVINTENIPCWLVLFPEGTRLTAEKLAKCQDYARRRRLPIPEHVMTPRSKGFTATCVGVRSHIQAVYDVTIGYPDGVPSVWQLMCGFVPQVYLHVRRFPLAGLPDTQEALAAWLMTLYQEKDRLLAYFAKHKQFPSAMPQRG